MKSDKLMTMQQLMGGVPLADVIESNIASEIAAQMIAKQMELNMNQEDFAEYLGISQAMTSRYEACAEALTVRELADVVSKLGLTADLVCRPTGRAEDSSL